MDPSYISFELILSTDRSRCSLQIFSIFHRIIRISIRFTNRDNSARCLLSTWLCGITIQIFRGYQN